VLVGTLVFNPTAAAAQFLAPGTYTITPSGLTSSNYAITFKTGTLTETQEDARAYYTGALFVSTSSPSSTTATVTLSATIKDITAVPADPAYDPYPGDIRNAKVTFINRDTNTIIAQNLPVGLVNLGDSTIGTVTYNWSVDIGSNNDSQQYTIGIIVSGYYTRNSSDDDTIVTVSIPPAAGSITGGGYLVMSNSAGLYPGAPGTKNNFGFNVKNSKGVKGNINTIVRNNGRVYQIKGNSMTSLTTQPATSTTGTATFNGKANIQDITDPLHPISIDGNATLQVTITDNGEPGSNDTIAVTLWNKNGGVWFTSNWNGTKTIEQKLGGGNLQVR
jgi:MBG domain (YGX type)